MNKYVILITLLNILAVIFLLILPITIQWPFSLPCSAATSIQIPYQHIRIPLDHEHTAHVRDYVSRKNHEPKTNQKLLELLPKLKDNSVVVDVGSHVGDTTVKLYQGIQALSHKSLTILAIDPNLEKVDFLKKLITLNTLESIEVIHAAVSNKQTHADEVKFGHAGGWKVHEHKAGKVRVDTIDNFMKHKKLGLLHLDVEGFEYKALLGAERTIIRDNPPLMVEVKHGKAKNLISPYLHDLGYVRIWAAENNVLFVPKSTFHIVVVCTPNYNHIGAYGVNSLYKYCEYHGYTFTLVQEGINNGLHVDFTKNKIAIDVLNNSTSDYIVNVDADIEILDLQRPLDSVIPWKADAVMYAPKDINPHSKRENSVINSGFIIWKNTPRSIEINELWLKKALHTCHNWATKHPRQQNVFSKCIYPFMAKNELCFLDHNEVGHFGSSFIGQTKKGKASWVKLGKPNKPIPILTNLHSVGISGALPTRTYELDHGSFLYFA